MKTALCISGQPRFFERGYISIKKHILDVNEDVDIFLHLWFDKKDVGRNGFSNTSKIAKKEHYNGDIIKNDTVEKLIDLYKPKNILSEPQYDCNHFIKSDYNQRGNLTSPFATYSQYLSTHRCIDLKKQYEKENNVEYDVVIKCRYDIDMVKNLDLGNYKFEQNDMFFHDDVNNKNRTIVNDGLFFGNNDEMSKMLSTGYLDFDQYWNIYKDIKWDNHDLLGKYLEIFNINFKKVNLGKIKWLRR